MPSTSRYKQQLNINEFDIEYSECHVSWPMQNVCYPWVVTKIKTNKWKALKHVSMQQGLFPVHCMVYVNVNVNDPPPDTPGGLCNAFCSEVCFSSLDVDFVEVVWPTESVNVEISTINWNFSILILPLPYHISNRNTSCRSRAKKPKPQKFEICSLYNYMVTTESEPPPPQVSTESPATTKSQTRGFEHHKKWIPTELVTLPWTESVVAKKVPPTKS